VKLGIGETATAHGGLDPVAAICIEPLEAEADQRSWRPAVSELVDRKRLSFLEFRHSLSATLTGSRTGVGVVGGEQGQGRRGRASRRFFNAASSLRPRLSRTISGGELTFEIRLRPVGSRFAARLLLENLLPPHLIEGSHGRVGAMLAGRHSAVLPGPGRLERGLGIGPFVLAWAIFPSRGKQALFEGFHLARLAVELAVEGWWRCPVSLATAKAAAPVVFSAFLQRKLVRRLRTGFALGSACFALILDSVSGCRFRRATSLCESFHQIRPACRWTDWSRILAGISALLDQIVGLAPQAGG